MSLTSKTNQEIFKQIMEIANNFNSEKENYLQAYSYFLNYFRKIDRIQLDDIVIGISFTYSWMPTILKKIDLTNSENLILILNKVKNGEVISIEEINLLKQAFNNSLVGTSKLLHFINPNKYAIWDSRVFKFLSGEKSYISKFKQAEIYIEYLQLLDNLKLEEDFNIFFTLIQHKVGYEISEYRALELAFYKGG
ncbi:hypothetical protein [Acinetobacter guillouiae]|uniref:hypothetical protein n=1 Tax=Acinetobacter guillouiae TaxID=106649 RepID=UPI0002CDA7CE|nr:hypothetical protein [Acinetobacter guillouiae]ENU60661.1 hypothetical protein F981_00574 [Acinetobacter guillouiae CIP 63.46]EPH35347.1 hypothetical protein L291_1889 [Acinetobacter guillouiae MSP4-18]KAB0630089.1 hypothetical protein F7P82_01920 [Acinetobacter guillouiae]